MYVIVAVALLARAAAQTDRDLIIYCSGNCLSQSNGKKLKDSTAYSTSEFCDVTENVPTPWKTHIPGPKADLQRVNWYVEEKQTGQRQLAINITWSEKGHWVDHKLQNGYLLQIVPSGSFNVKYNVIVKAKNYLLRSGGSRPRYRKIYFNYKCFGLSKETFVSPGKTYIIVLKTLPVSPQNLDHLFDSAVISVPDCNDDSIKNTRNCKPADLDIYSSSTTVTFSTKRPTTLISTNGICCDNYPLMILLCIGGLLILGIIYLGYQLHQQALYAADLPLDKHVLIVMDNLSFEDHLYAKAGDELARLLKFVVKRVTYSMWQATEISRVGMEAWFAKYAAEVDCVIVICTSCSNLEKLKRSNKEIHFHTEGQLKTHTYIASQATKCNHLSYCSVHFSEKSAPCKFSPTCYTLPQDCASFMKKLSAFTLPSNLQNTAKGRLGYWSKQLSNPQDMVLFTHPKSQETTLIKASSIDPLNIEMEYVCSL